MNWQRVVQVGAETITETAADDPLIEVNLSAVAAAEILRVQIGAAQQATPPTPTPYAFYTATAAGTGGAAMNENVVTGDGTVLGTALSGLTALPVTGLIEFPQGAVVWETGELWLPTPEERFLLFGGGQDFFGVHFLLAPSVSVITTVMIEWGEVG